MGFCNVLVSCFIVNKRFHFISFEFWVYFRIQQPSIEPRFGLLVFWVLASCLFAMLVSFVPSKNGMSIRTILSEWFIRRRKKIKKQKLENQMVSQQISKLQCILVYFKFDKRISQFKVTLTKHTNTCKKKPGAAADLLKLIYNINQFSRKQRYAYHINIALMHVEHDESERN